MLKRIASVFRPALVLLGVFIGSGFAIIAYQAVRTLQQLNNDCRIVISLEAGIGPLDQCDRF